MKHCLYILLFELFSTVCTFSQTALQEFVIEKDDNPQVFYKGKGCTPDVGVIVFYTTISDLNFSMPDTPNRLKNTSAFDKENNCYVLCVQPTDTRIGGIAQYSIAITANGYKPMPAFMVSGINAEVAQYYKINPKNEGEELNFVFKGIEKGKNSTVKLYLDDQLIGETNFNKGFQFKFMDTKQGMHQLRVIWAKQEWKGIINTTEKTVFIFEYKKKSTGFGYKPYFELVK